MANVLGVLRSSLGAFLAWWLRELAGLIPKRLRSAGRRDRPRLAVELGSDELRLYQVAGEGDRLLGCIDPDAADAERQVKALLKAARARRSGATVRLAPEQGLRKVLDLPLAAREHVEQALRLEMDRLTPFRADEVYFACRVLKSDPERRRLAVELEVAPRALVEHALSTAERVGLQPRRLELARRPGAAAEEGLDLLPRDPTEAQSGSRLNRLLALLALALAAAAVIIPLYQERSTAAGLEHDVAAARAEAEKSMQLRNRLDALTRAARFVVEEKTRAPMVGEVLAELTRLIPDQAYVIQLHMSDGAIQLHGLARTASELIALLERSPLFRSPQFRSPVTRDPRSDLERFHISVELAPGNAA